MLNEPYNTIIFTLMALKWLAQAKIIKKIGDFVSGSWYDHMM